MKKKSRGQSLVEFALVFPIIMLFVFGSIDFGYYVYAWAQVQFAARRGGEQASIMQPRQVMAATGYHNPAYIQTDPCLRGIFFEADNSGSFHTPTDINPSAVFIEYFTSSTSSTPVTTADANRLGNIIQVRIYRELDPLTPILETIKRGVPMRFTAVSRRTIVSNGPGRPMVDVDGNNYETCLNP